MIAWFFNLFRRKPEKARSEPYVNGRSQDYYSGARSGRVSAEKPNPSARPVSSRTHHTHIDQSFLFHPEPDNTRRSSSENETRVVHTPTPYFSCSSNRSSGGESSHYSDSGGDSGGGGGCD